MTSIEWLDEQLQEHIISQDLVAQNLIIQISVSEYLELKRQAKEMHKQEIINAANQNKFNDIDGLGICETITKGEQYYNETFKKD